VALIKALKTMLAVCLDEHRRQSVEFDRNAWTEIRDLAESPAFVRAFARLDDREEDRVFSGELDKLIADVVRVAQIEKDMSPEERECRLREEYPLFPDADLSDELDAAKRISKAGATKSAPAKTQVMRRQVLEAICDWADIDKIQAETGLSQKQVLSILNGKQLLRRLNRRTVESGRVEYKLKDAL
jgi:hypothetical protein